MQKVAPPNQCWLLKSEPNEFSIQDLQESDNQTTYWDGVRNYQARNFMRDDMQVGDKVLYYHSRINPSIVGTAVIVKSGYPDFTSWDPEDNHFDPKSNPEKPTWYMVDIQFKTEFPHPLLLPSLREVEGLENMVLLRKGSRLSVQPVTPKEYEIILSIAN